jgi:hypothetical protein
VTTSTDLVQETIRYLYSGSRDPYNKLSNDLNAVEDTVVLTYELGAARAGAVLSVDLELMYVWDVVDEAGKILTVERGYLGSTAATHSTGAFVTINPKFSQFAILAAINADLDDLSSSGLFAEATLTTTYNASVQGYDLTGVTNVTEILQVKYDEPGPAKLWPEIKSFKLRRSSATSDFSSGLALVLYEGGQTGSPLKITYGTAFTKFTGLGENVTVTGLPLTAYDLPPLGAALRLQYMREGQRNFNEAQPTSRRADEVPQGANLRAAGGIQQLRKERIRDERNALRKNWPNRRHL